jgi:hypothetical protein
MEYFDKSRSINMNKEIKSLKGNKYLTEVCFHGGESGFI